jgi:predicted nucleic acid-binding protein
MTKIFIDTDVILDFLTDRKPFSHEAVSIFTLIGRKEIRGYTSSLTYSNLYYVLRKDSTHKKVISKLEELTNFAEILNVDEQVIKSALSSNFKDFEDAIQNFSAQKQKKIDVIITRNTKDYKESELPVMTPGTFVKTLKQVSSE